MNTLRYLRLLVTVMMLATLLCAHPASAVVYVKWDSLGVEDGDTWETAYRTIQAGIDDADLANEEVFVAEGAYLETITLKNGVRLYGGYDGSSGTRAPDVYVTTIGGSSGTQDVVTCENTTTIDGFDIRDGQHGLYASSATSIVIANNKFCNNSGHGVYLSGCQSITLTDNSFENNRAWAAYLDIAGGSTTFGGNSSMSNGGNGLYIKGVISANTTWPAQTGFPYVIAGTLHVSPGSTLYVEPSSVVKFTSDGELLCGGTLQVGAPPETPVHFTSIKDDRFGGDTNADGSATSPAPGDWQRIYAIGMGSRAMLNGCVILYGGRDWTPAVGCDGGIFLLTNSTVADSAYIGVYAYGGLAPRVIDCVIRDCGGNGVYMQGVTSPVLEGNTLSGNADYAASLCSALGTLAVSGNSGWDNGGNGVQVVDCTVSGDTVWSPQTDFPYVISGALNVSAGKKLTISADTVVKFAQGAEVACHGIISAEGVPTAPVHITSVKDDSVGGDTNADGSASSPAPGDWRRIHLAGIGSSGSFTSCHVRYGGSGSSWLIGCESGMLNIIESVLGYSAHKGVYAANMPSARVGGCTLKHCADNGVYMQSVTLPQINSNQFLSNGAYAARLVSIAGDISFSSNSGSGNAGNGVQLSDCTITANSGWISPQPEFPYVIDGTLTINNSSRLTLDSYSVVKLMEASQIICNGILEAQGLPSRPITFTSVKDDSIGGDTNGDAAATLPSPGDWQRVSISGPNSSGLFTECVFRYGGSGSSYCVGYENTAVAITDSTVANSANHGIYCSKTTDTRILRCSTESCAGNGIYIHNVTSPVITDCTFTDNADYAACLVSATGNLTFSGNNGSGNKGNGMQFSNCTVSTDTRWYAQTNFPYVINGTLNVNASYRLAIDPGAVVKFLPNSQIYCTGILEAIQVAGQHIYFTSAKDDAYGGDTNGDGADTSPNPGDWQRVHVSGPQAVGNFDGCVFRYGGAGSTWCVGADTAAFSLVNSTILGSASNGVYVYGSAIPTVEACDISNCAASGIHLESVASPVVTSNVLGGNGGSAAYISSSSGSLTLSGNSGLDNACNGIQLCNCTIGTNSHWFAQPGLPYVVKGGLLLNNGTLTIDPGVVTKFQPGAQIRASGELKAIGTLESPIYFTSIKDDAVGGDTNADADATRPASGDWEKVQCSVAARPSNFEHCVFRYGGSNSTWCVGGALRLTNCDITHSANIGVYSGVMSPVVERCIVAYNAGNGVYLTGTNPGITYTNLWANSGNTFGPSPTLTGTIEADPQFVETSEGDFRLLPLSPCIDTGNPDIHDPDGSPIDMGALAPLPCVAFAKTRPDGTPVYIEDAVSTLRTGIYPDGIYIEQPDRCAGIRVDTGQSTPAGIRVAVTGTIYTQCGERHIKAAGIATGEAASIAPLELTSRALGGAGWHYDPATGAGQRGAFDGVGLNNIGLLVRTTGTVTQADSTSFTIDDGSGTQVICIVPDGVALPTVSSSVGVTGISTCGSDGVPLVRWIRVRYQSDIQAF